MLRSRLAVGAALASLIASCSTEIPHPPPDAPTGGEQALAFRVLSHQDENGAIPDNGWVDGLNAYRALQAPESLNGIAGIRSDRWVERGPFNWGGRCRALAFDPADPSRMLCGSVSGGIFESTDGAQSWHQVDDFMGNLSVMSIVFDPNDSNHVLAGTGEGYVRGAGIFESRDRGRTWSQVASTASSDFHFTYRISWDAGGAAVFAATGSGLWRSTDGGTTWVRNLGSYAREVACHPTKPGVAVAQATLNGQTILHFTNNAGGLWFAGNGGRAGGNVRTIFAWHEGFTGPGDGCCYGLQAGTGNLLRTVDGGRNWSTISRPDLASGYLGSLWVDPADQNANPNDDFVIAGGVDLWKSTDGGANFTQFSRWQSWQLQRVSVHADQHLVIQSPTYDGQSDKRIWVLNDSGLWTARDVYATTSLTGWEPRITGLAVAQFYGGSGNATQLYGGTQDNGTLSVTLGNGQPSWRRPSAGDGGFCASDWTDPNYHYGEYIYLTIHRSTNGGRSASSIYQGIGDAQSGSANFIAPFILDPNDPRRMYAGGRRLWRSNDVKAPTPSWAALPNPRFISANLSAIAVPQGHPNEVWTGRNNGTVEITRNAQSANPTWTIVGAGVLPRRMNTRITFDPQDKNHVFATFGGFRSDNLWESTDGGANWTVIQGLPAVPLRDIDLHPTNSRWWYVASELGVLISDDAGQTWVSATEGPADVAVDEMFWRGDELVAVTYGRGFFTQVPFTCTAPPTLTAMTPTTTIARSPTQLTLVGANLDEVEEITIGGVPVDSFRTVSPGVLEANMSIETPIGRQPVIASNPCGSSSPIFLDVQPRNPPNLSGPFLAVRGAPFEFAIRGDRDWTAVLFASVFNGPSSLPGIVDLEIGSNFAWILDVATLQLDATGFAATTFTLPTNVPPQNLYFEAITWDPTGFTLPLDTTNALPVRYL